MQLRPLDFQLLLLHSAVSGFSLVASASWFLTSTDFCFSIMFVLSMFFLDFAVFLSVHELFFTVRVLYIYIVSHNL